MPPTANALMREPLQSWYGRGLQGAFHYRLLSHLRRSRHSPPDGGQARRAGG